MCRRRHAIWALYDIYDISALFQNGWALPVTWSHLSHRTKISDLCNLRFLLDLASIVSVGLNESAVGELFLLHQPGNRCEPPKKLLGTVASVSRFSSHWIVAALAPRHSRCDLAPFRHLSFNKSLSDTVIHFVVFQPVVFGPGF